MSGLYDPTLSQQDLVAQAILARGLQVTPLVYKEHVGTLLVALHSGLTGQLVLEQSTAALVAVLPSERLQFALGGRVFRRYAPAPFGAAANVGGAGLCNGAAVVTFVVRAGFGAHWALLGRGAVDWAAAAANDVAALWRSNRKDELDELV
ncbi:hypothetical protein HDU99_002134, partial [Rhizoclosmatium hyalinum]